METVDFYVDVFEGEDDTGQEDGHACKIELSKSRCRMMLRVCPWAGVV